MARSKKRLEPAPPLSAWWTEHPALAVFALAWLLRLLYVQATPDSTWAGSAAFKGDADLWLDYARALHAGRPFELGLPIHTPGNAYLIAALWDGGARGIHSLRLLWTAFGALAAALFCAAARQACGARAALVSGLVGAACAGPLVLSSSLNNETPYLVLVAATLALGQRVAERPDAARLAAWALLHALACLFRVEHALWAGLWFAWLTWRWRAGPPRATARELCLRLALAGGAVLAALAPWHLHAWRAVARFNSRSPELTFAEQAARTQVAARYGVVTWSDEAARRREALPAFARDTSALFVAATVAHRGRDRVEAGDFDLLEEAFGSVPRPLASRPFVSLYGPLNFALANHVGADGGFSTTLLEERPPAAARTTAFPPELIAGLPPPQLAFIYPPHLALVNDGYALGLRWIAGHPLDFAHLAGRKLQRFWAGAALGLGGFNLPLGVSGTRHAVDLVTPEPGWTSGVWQLALLALTLAGARLAWSRPALVPWLLFVASKAALAVAFFGYARQGALVAPAVALLVVLLLAPALERQPLRAVGRAALAASLLLVALEGARALRPPRLTLDGRPIDAGDPFPPDHHRAVRYEAR
jgi:hypothetical protein